MLSAVCVAPCSFLPRVTGHTRVQLKEEEGVFKVAGLPSRRGEVRLVCACELREPYRESVLEVAVQVLVEVLDLFQ